MLKLHSNALFQLGEFTEQEGGIRRLAIHSTERSEADRHEDYLLVRDSSAPPPGYAGYLFFDWPSGAVPTNSFHVEGELSFVQAGDVVRISPKRNTLRVLYRRNSSHNSLLVTERCDNFCLMCSQPPKDVDDWHLVEDEMRAIPLMSLETKSIGITGGEPGLLGPKLIELVGCLKQHLPKTAVHILSNGRAFKESRFAQALANIRHPDLMVGIPIYSDLALKHNYVVQAQGAFDDTIRGILNLKTAGARVEIRVVIHRQTYERLPELAEFLCRNLRFCDHIALMGLELTGFARANLDLLWIDPVEYQPQLRRAVELLDGAGMPVSIYNHQLCLLHPELFAFAQRSISDWKNEYMPECCGCVRKEQCGGFFSSARLRYSPHIKAFRF
jgi:His-Xaa-Ser system radical SAM maturase HxsC